MDMQGQGQRFLTVPEAARELRMSYGGTLQLIHKGLLPAARLGKSYRIRRDGLDEALRRLEQVEVATT